MFVVGAGLAAGAGYYVYQRFIAPGFTQEPVPMTSIDVTTRQVTLKKQYSKMENKLREKNLNLEFILSLEECYGPNPTGKECGTRLTALPYRSPDICRLIVLPMDDDTALARNLFQAAATVLTVIPAAFQVFQNPAEILHLTIFHTSRPESPVPQDGDTAQYLEMEKTKLGALLKKTKTPILTFDRIILADSGVLLALWIEETEVCHELRKNLRVEFPTAPSKQTSILHSSLFRIVTPKHLDNGVIDEVVKTCQTVSEGLKGTVWTPKKARVVHESHFSTIEGRHFDFKFV